MSKFLRRRTLLKGLLGLPILGLGSALYVSKVEPAWLQVNQVPLALPRLPAAFDDYCVVQLSDIHADEAWMNQARLRHIVKMTNQLAPDLVVITGDFITSRPWPQLSTILSELRNLRAPDGVLATMGNHDHWSDVAWVRQEIAAQGIREITQGWHTLSRSGQSLHIAGFEDLWQEPQIKLPLISHVPRLTQLTSALPSDGAAILLVHEPDFADVSAANGRFDLQLSGHSHGGQCRIPFGDSPVLPTFGKKYYSGHYRIGGMQLYTHRGLGMVSPQVRFNCRPEVAAFTLRSAR